MRILSKIILLSYFSFGIMGAKAQEAASTLTGGRDMTYHGQNYDVLDTMYISKKRRTQFNDFVNYKYDFPPRPKNMIQVGVGLGLYNVSGDVQTLMLWNKGGYGLHLQARKALGYIVSIRANYTYGIAKGLDWRPQGVDGVSGNPVFNGQQNGTYNPETDYVKAKQSPFHAYRMESHQFNMDGVFSLNNLLFNKAKKKTSFYAFAGVGAFAYHTEMNLTDANGKMYDFNSLENDMKANGIVKYGDRVSKIQSFMDGSYETDANNYSKPYDKSLGKNILRWSASGGVGMEVRISSRVALQIEDRITFTGDDRLDGKVNVWGNVPSQSSDRVNYFSTGLNFQLGKTTTRVAPLWWLNPLDYVYSEISNPRHLKVPDAVIKDEDGDGIGDQLDKCPNTPAGQSVDAHGCPMDTDGDGVPDFRDKQLITPTECQPVDADGVGNCPCPTGCQSASNPANACNIAPNTLTFENNSNKISATIQTQLMNLAAQINASPSCRVVIAGNGNVSKHEQQRSWDRVEAVIVYMNEKFSIDRSRFIFQYAQSGTANTVNYRAAAIGEDGPVTQAPPFPNLIKK
jgi:outer membrane protein OmpA-like peptidoglycan-associated protein